MIKRRNFVLKPPLETATSSIEAAFMVMTQSYIGIHKIIDSVHPINDILAYGGETIRHLTIDRRIGVRMPTCISADYPFTLTMYLPTRKMSFDIPADTMFYITIPCMVSMSVQNSYKFITFNLSVEDSNPEKLRRCLVDIIDHIYSEELTPADYSFDQDDHSRLAILCTTESYMDVDDRRLTCRDKDNLYPIYQIKPNTHFDLHQVFIIPHHLSSEYISICKIISCIAKEKISYPPHRGGIESVFDIDIVDNEEFDRPPSRCYGPSSVGSL